MKSYEIITPIQFDPTKPAKKSGVVQLEAEVGDEMVKLGALRPVDGDEPESSDEGDEKSLEELAKEMLGKMTVKQLTDLAVKSSITVPEKATKAQIIELLEAKRDEAEKQTVDAAAVT